MRPRDFLPSGPLVLRVYHETAGGGLRILIPPAHAYLVDLLVKAFEGMRDVEVIVDRRRGERRTGRQPVALERRRGERRGTPGEMGEIVITSTRAPVTRA